MPSTVFHPADSRGHANHGWLDTYHTFSFASYHNPERMGFGALRVLNDDTVAGGRGFAEHAHRDMEIVSIPLEGDLEHRDSIGNTTVIRNGDVQVMSAGTGVRHSEKNHSLREPVKFLQIWVQPNQRSVEPRYDQITLNLADRHNKLQQVLSPSSEDEGVWAHQNAWFHLGTLDAGRQLSYDIHAAENGIYVFVLSGAVSVDDQALGTRDGLGVWDTKRIELSANENAEVLLMEVPMG